MSEKRMEEKTFHMSLVSGDQQLLNGSNSSMPREHPDLIAINGDSRIVTNGGLVGDKQDLRDSLIGTKPLVASAPQTRIGDLFKTFEGVSQEDARWPIRIQPNVTQLLRSLALQQNVDLFNTLLAAWTVVLSRLTGQENFIIALHNKLSQSSDGGNTAASSHFTLQIDLSEDPDTAHLLERIRAALQISGDSHGHDDPPQVAFNWSSHGQQSTTLSSRFKLALDLQDTGDQIVGAIHYATSLFDSTTIERHVGYIYKILEGMVSDKTQPVTEIDMLSSLERSLMLQTWNATQDDYPYQLCLHHLFELQVSRTPESTAVVFEDRSLTYSELNTRANRLAHHLIKLGVHPDMPVAISVERSPEMIIGILAILKAGGAYVPLDPFYASDRLKDILDDTTPTVLVADKTGQAAMGDEVLSSLAVVDPSALLLEDTNNPRLDQLTSRHIAYIIYTSGSTGKPKGVMVEHQGAVNLVHSRPRMFGIDTDSRYLQFASFNFSHSVSEIFSTLTAGASLYLLRNEIRLDRSRLWDFLRTHSITHVSFTATLLQDCKNMPPLHSLRTLITVGEAVPSTLPREFRAVAPNITILNNYGSSEITSGIVWRCPKDYSGDEVPIGRPISNKRIYILDAHANPVPLGTVGEMYVGGVGLARGYWGKPELTAERFVPDPFVGDSNARMYRTGDLGRFLPDGNVVYHGRNDYQIKIRGFRVELGEIEARLHEHPLLAEAVVLAIGDGANKRLVAYVTTKSGDQQSQDKSQLAMTLRSYLGSKLPEYMVPGAYVYMEKFPLNANGKLDRKALPAPSDDDLARAAYEEPQGEVETALATIWGELLHLDRVGRHDSFFTLGGHSLLAIQMISRLQDLGYSLSVRNLFDAPTLSVLAQSVGEYHDVIIPQNHITPGINRITPDLLPLIDLTQSDIDTIVKQVPGGVANVQDIYALSPLQDGILFHHLMAKEGDPYVAIVSMAFDTRELLDRYLVAVQEIVNCHEILRTSFIWEGLSTPAQVVWREASLSVTELQLDPAQGPITQQLKSKFNPRSHRMDLTKAPLLHFVVAQEGDGRWILARLQHHLITDRSTSETLNAEILAFLEGRGDTLPPPQPYRNLIAQTRLGADEDGHERFFKEMLADIDSPSLPYGLLDVHGEAAEIGHSRRVLPQELNKRLRSQARKLGVSLASLCHFAWALVIARTSGQEHVVFGTVLFGRMQASTSQSRSMGLFINTLPIRVDIDEQSVEDSVRATHARLASLLEHEHASLALAQRCSSVPSGTPLFSSLLNYMHNSISPGSTPFLPGMEPLGIQDRTNYPLCISVEDFGDALGLTTQTLEPIESERICGYMQQALESLAGALEQAPTKAGFELEVLPQEERTTLLQTLNTQEVHPDHLCMHHLFEQQVVRAPDAIAVVHNDQSLTYSELNARANRLAHHLIKLGVQPDNLVAICVERSPEMIIGLLAILKAGGAYLPLDPAHASERLFDIVTDASPSIVLADPHGATALREAGLTGLNMFDLSAAIEGPTANPHIPNLSSRHLAYVIYTSGSTGKPKGVMVEHRQVIRLFSATGCWYDFTEKDAWTLLHSFAFDFSVWEIWGALRFGGRLVLVPYDIARSPLELYGLLCQQGITVLNITPSAFRPIAEDHAKEGQRDSLRYIIFGGEALAPATLQPWFLTHAQDQPQVVNMYGITETTVHVTYRLMTPEDCGKLSSPIGVGIPDLRTYVLDSRGRPVPFGAVGELFVGGAGVTRGYLNRPELTADRFIPDPFVRDTEARMYKTGDLVRYLPDGDLAYLGRNDHQVKIRGFRIELGEIEARLHEHPLVSEVIVLAVGEDSGKRLVAYVVTKPEDQLDGIPEQDKTQLAMTLRSHLALKLPEYMVPGAFVRMDKFPLTSNGKIDRRALPIPGVNDLAREAYEEPQGEIEIALASIWAELLNLDRVSRHDSFFTLGGHSLMAVRMMNRIAGLGTTLPLATLFATPSLSAFAEEIKKHLEQDIAVLPSIEQIPRTELLPLSSAQQRMWFLAQLDGVSDIYHVPMPIRLSGFLDQKALQRAVNELFARHEGLRSVFVTISGQPHVQILPPQELPVEYIDLRGAEDAEGQLARLATNQVKKSFDLATGPLIRVALIQVADDDQLLLVTQHHIISDGWSLAILARELSQLYSAYHRNEDSPLTPLGVQYPDYAAWHQQWFSGDRLNEQSEYWRATLADAPVLIDLPTDRLRPPQLSYAGSRVPVSLDAELTDALRRFSQKHGVTMFMTVLAAWSVVLSRLSGQNDVVIGTPSANRGHRDIEPLIGLFVNTLALRIDLSDKPTMRELLERVRRCTLTAHSHQDLPFEQVVDSVKPPRRMNQTPLFQVLFAWQNNEASDLKFDGIQATPFALRYEVARFDLELGLYEVDGEVVGSLRYSTALFDHSTIERHVGYLTTMLREMVSDANRPISTPVLLSQAERTMLLETWNTTQDYGTDLCLHQLFEQQVVRTPEAIALVCGNRRMTYSELNTRSNRLAHHLIQLGVKPDTLVGICVERSLGMIIGILAIMKAGGAYVPLDPTYASDRLRDILSDASPSIVLADTAGTAVIQGLDLSRFTTIDPNSSFDSPITNPHVPSLETRHLVYVLYTSGSTGKPKGVMLEHGKVTRLFSSTYDWFKFNEQDTWTLVHSFGFDVSVWEMWGALRNGGKLVLVPQDLVLAPQELYRLICEQGVTVLNLTPSTFKPIIDIHATSGLHDRLRYVILAGEALAPAMLRPWYATHAQDMPLIVNMYGPTETIHATYRPMKLTDCDQSDSIIGVRIPDLRMYILDENGQPLPRGAVGELFIGGASVARGYLNRPELTADRFLLDPFVGDGDARMYKTGDLVRFLPDGNLVYLGRNDHQVKVRGFRIELGEIEARLHEHPLVSEAVVLAIGDDTGKRLVAYVIAKPDDQVSEDEDQDKAQLAMALRSYLMTKLPEYMVPGAYVRMDKFPVNTNGKLDRKALPVPGDDDLAREAYEEPQGEIEIALASIWAELLHLDRVGRHDSFFTLGGHSLLAVRLMNRVASLGTILPLTTLFAAPSLSGFAEEIKMRLDQDTNVVSTIECIPRTELLPLSSAQQRLWFLTQLDGVSDIYHVPTAIRLRGFLDRKAWQFAVDELFARHEALRSVFVTINGQPHVQILPAEGLPVEYIDLRGTADTEEQLLKLAAKEAKASFDLERGPLIRVTLVQAADDDHLLLVTQHHIISDGWSMAIVTRELSQLYSAHRRNEDSYLPPLTVQYPDYAAWHQEWFSGDRLTEQSEFWRTALADTPVLIDLPTDRPRPLQQSYEGSRVPIKLDAELTSALRRFSQKHGVTMFMTVLAAWSVVLSRLSGQDDVVIGTPTANRGHHEIESLIGFFVNTLALRVDLSGKPTIRELLERVRQHTLDAYSHQDLPFEQVVEITKPPRSMNHTPLFQVMFAWQNNEASELNLDGVQATSFGLHYDAVKYDLELMFFESDEKIVGSLRYATSLFDHATIEKHVGYLITMLQEMTSDVNQSISAPVLLSSDERTLLLETWNATQEDYPTDVCLHHKFEQQVLRTPEATAIVCEDKSMTYSELNARANSLAHHLIQLGVKPETLVGICVERSLGMIVGVLAILKAGGAYLPLDPAFASDRLRDILSDASPSIVLADTTGTAAIQGLDLSRFTMIDPNSSFGGPTTNPQVSHLTSRNLAYVIYTSGTTGKPKGVMLEHQGVLNLIQTRQSFAGVDSRSRLSQFFSFNFDSSVSEIFPALCLGSTLHILRDTVRLDLHRLWEYLERNSITHVLITPAVLQDSEGLPPLSTPTTFIIAGEALPAALVRKMRDLLPHCTIINEYGPTETTVAATAWKFTTNLHTDIVPIGRPYANKRLYILDTHGNPVPHGAVGELFVGGVGVARGYLNRPELTEERFLRDPFVGDAGARMYRTGDLVRYLPDGNVVFLGRNDHQIKIRGFRIELGEIEARLHEHPLLAEAAVFAIGEGANKRLVAYVIAKADDQVSEDEDQDKAQFAMTLRSYLMAKLPEYMVPGAFVRMDKFPLTANGKIDRRALPVPSDDDLAREAYEEPQGEIETALASIWAELLHLDRVSRHDSFFTLGGHSLLAVRLMNRVASFGTILPLTTLFAAPSLSGFAEEIKKRLDQDTDIVSTIECIPRTGLLPLSSAQQRLWFLAQLDGVSDIYHIPTALRLHGFLDRKSLQFAVDELFARHEGLRSVFVATNGQPHVEILPPTGLPVEYIDLRGTADTEAQLVKLAAKEAKLPFDLAKGPLIRVTLVQAADDDHLLLVTKHHIVSDGWSMAIMTRELSQLYSAHRRNEDSYLPPLGIQYPDYAAWHHEWFAGDRLNEQSEYWRYTLADAPVLIDLPTDRPRPLQQSYTGAGVPIKLDAELTNSLRRFSQKHGVTMFMTVLAAWSVVLSRLSGQDDVVIGTPTANRGHHEIESLIGFFVNTLALRVDLSGKPTIRELLERVRQRTLDAYGHQDLPFEQVVEIVKPPRSMNHTPLFQVMFVWQNNEASELNLDGVQATSFGLHYDAVKFDLELGFTESDEKIVGSLRYATSMFDRATIEKHAGYLITILQEMSSDVNQSISAPVLLSSDERTLLLETWNATQEDYPTDVCLHHKFEQQVLRTPEATAIVCEDKSMTYSELNARANSLAHHLIQLGVKPETLVGICVERSLGMIVGVLAILKAGGAYLPLDPAFASDRLRDILSDASPSIVLADTTGTAAIQGLDLSRFTMIDPNSSFGGPTTNHQVSHLTSRNLAYVIYTSGTTGKPKGVMLEHQGVLNLIQTRQSFAGVDSRSRLSQFFSFNFDSSVSEIFPALCLGSTLHILRDTVRLDLHRLWEYLERNSITHVLITPAVLQDSEGLPPLSTPTTFIIAGEALPAALVRKMRDLLPHCTIINEYGPTETTVAATAWKFTTNLHTDIVPIGRPYANKRLYILDTHGNPVPHGAVGELFVGGVGVARGYLNRPELTEERFLRDPFVGDAGARMYRTGDLVRYLPDGNVVFLGRNDHQIKIRGFRIELGEIEARLHEHPLLAEAAVFAIGEGANKRLVAYVIAKADDQVSEDEDQDKAQFAMTLRSYLMAKLPEYMVPGAFVRMDKFPLTANGKIDRRALPVPSDDDLAREAYEEPQGKIEQALASVWSDLLKVTRVSRHDSFFTLGGHSLLAIQMISRLQNLGYSLSVRNLFEAPTLSVLAQSVGEYHDFIIPQNCITPGVDRITPDLLPLIDLTQSDINTIVKQVPGGVSNVQDIYALSPLQDGILFHHLMAKEGDPYLLFVLTAFNDRESLDRYLAAIQQTVQRHDILRTGFIWEGLSTPAQVVLREVSLSVTELQLDPAQGPIAQQLKSKFNPRYHRIDLTKAQLLRFAVAQDIDGRWLLVRLQHHLIGDHSTMDIMNEEIQAFLAGQGDTLHPPQPYRNLIAQTRLGASQDEHERFFKGMLADIDTPSLPYGLLDVHGEGAGVALSHCMLPQELNKRLRSQARKLGVSLASLCHFAWALVIARTSGQEHVVFGTVLFGRMQAGSNQDRAMGLFINTLPIRVDIDEQSVEDSVRATHARLASLLEHEHASLALAQRCSSVPSGTPLFNSLLNYRHNAAPSSSTPSLSGKYLDSQEHTNYPMDISVEDFGESLGLTVETLEPIAPERVCGYMQQALESLASALERTPTMAGFELEVLPQEERTTLLQTLSTTQEAHPDHLCMHQLFEQQVVRAPDAIAVVHNNQSLTYSEVNARANRLAHHLIKLGVQPDNLVAICVERSPDMIIGLLAILKAGGAYVPLDPSYASDRLVDILEDAAPAILLADNIGRSALGETALSRVTVVDPSVLEQYPTSNPQLPQLTPQHLAYVIYTSGSTGKPKGVLVEHHGAVHLVSSEVELFGINSSSRIMQFTSVSFDNSVSEIFSALASAARLYLLQDDIRLDKDRLWEFIIEHSITYISLTPTMLQGCEDMPPLNSLQTVIAMGEAMPPSLPQSLKVMAPNSSVINAYGPTETTVGALVWKYSADFSGDIVPIGRPYSNKRVYLLDERGKPVPLGAVGELFIGGVGVARGYLNRPDLTAERFLVDPFAGDAEARMYKTGDLARYLPDGNLLYLGRNDHQVKIRGFRIELGEIEARLHEHPLVSEAVVVAIGEEARKQLVAYVIAEAEGDHAVQLSKVLRTHLATKLPEYMVPAAFVRMDTFPLTSNGKLDRRALPTPDDDAFARQAYEPPQGTVEMAISNIWLDILNVDRIGRHDDFFMIGGHSLLALKMVSRIRHVLGFEISLRTIFDGPTIAKLAKRLGESGTASDETFHVLLPIKSKGSRAPLFCVHPVLGLSWCFIGLSKHLHPDQPLYGLQARGFYDDAKVASTLDEMTLDYIAQIRRVQPHGPYHLLGFSFGGLVAHTMAAYLEKQGEKVALVALMDTPADYHTSDYSSPDKDQNEFDPTKILRGDNGDDDVPELAKSFFDKTPQIMENNSRLSQSQAPLVFGGDISVFRATVPTEGFDDPVAAEDWKAYVLGKVDVHDIHCEHEDMIKPEPLAQIGQILAQKLEECHQRDQKEI